MPAPRNFSISPIRRTDVFQEVYRRLDAFVADASLRPGDRLPSERDLAERLGVSRTSVRQALKILEASGRITSRIGSGTYVAERRPDALPGAIPVPAEVDGAFLERLAHARALIEAEIFGLFCDRRTEEQLRGLEALPAVNGADPISNADEIVGLDTSFEDRVGELLGDEVLHALQRQVHQAWGIAWMRCGRPPDGEENLRAEHRELLDALRARNRALVVRLIRRHVDRRT